MASLNGSAKGKMKTTNISGHAAYKLDEKTKLVTMALTTMIGEPKFYGDNTDDLIKLAEELCQCGEGEFVAKLAVWARTKANLRSVSHVLTAIVVRLCSGERYVRQTVRTIASMRGDDGTEIMAAYLSLYGKEDKARHPNALRKGLRDALEGMSPYSIAKYQSKNKEVKLRDVIRLVRPKSISEAQREAFDRCVQDTLPMPKGWETELSERGNTKEVWDELIAEDRLGIFACLRNMRNIVAAGANIDPILEKLQSPEVIENSRLLPFRFFSAYQELAKAGIASSKVTSAIDTAMKLACANVPHLDGNTAVLIDTSGSMGQSVSARSVTTCRDIAAVLGAMSVHMCDNAWVCGFDSMAKVIPMTGLSVLADMLMVKDAGGPTYMKAGFRELIGSGFDADRVIVISDNEVNGYSWWSRTSKPMQACADEYRKHVGHDVWVHAIDVMGYGTVQFCGDHTNILAGWNERVLELIGLSERGFGTIVKAVEEVPL